MSAQTFDVGLLVALSTLGGSDEVQVAEVNEDAGADTGTGAVDVVDAAFVRAAPDAITIPNVPMTEEHMAPALAAWQEPGLSTTDFADKLDDDRANGSCRVGKVDSLRVLICVAVSDPVRRGKIMRRALPGDSKPRKWRGRIKRGDIQIRVESGSKKNKRERRRIEAIFRGLPR